LSNPAPDNLDEWTIGKVLRFATDDFQKRRHPSPRLDAELLLGDVLALDRVQLLVQSTRLLDPSELSRYRDSIRRRRGGEPVAYILGYREFYGRKFTVDRRVLVPRPETELLLEVALRRTMHRHLSGRALDVCTGSGCVAVSFALERRTWQVTGTDLSKGALEVARKNAESLGAVWGVDFRAGDLFDALPEASRFELIVSNPPYIPSPEIPTLMTDVRDFEPHMALDGGQDGLAFYRRLAVQSSGRLVPGGVLCVEVGAGQAPDVAALFRAAGMVDLEIDKDYAGHERVVSGRRGPTAGSPTAR
jgi:release factor glutamine methyltransferase